MKRRGTRNRDRTPAPAKPPAALGADLRDKRNRALNQQTRKLLRRHYAARYRVR